MDKYFIDSDNIICYDGIRAVQKAPAGIYRNGFSITIMYKGISNVLLNYPTLEAADNAFRVITEQLSLRNRR